MMITEVNTYGYLSQLSEEVVISYDTGGGGDTVTNIVTALLAFQSKATKVTVGTINPVDTREFKIENKTILCALLQLWESVGGYIYVDNNRALQWRTTIGEDKGQQIRYRKNLKGITKETNYNDLCTKLHPIGSGVALSDIDIVKELADEDSDINFGYLTLTGQYSCYKDWTGLGDALPGHVTVYKELPAKISLTPMDAGDPGAGWNNEANAYDGNLATFAESGIIAAGAWTQWLQFQFSALAADAPLMNGARYYANVLAGAGDAFDYIQVEITTDAITWTNVYNSGVIPPAENWSNQWIEFAFATQLAWGLQVRFRRRAGAIADTIEFKEFEGRTDYQDDSAVWTQGADERTVRCAIGDYDAASTYYISYTHASYLIAWDKIVTDDDLISKVLTNRFEEYADSLLEAGRLMLDDIKNVPVSYSIDAVDLSESDSLTLDFDALQIGSIIKVIDEDLGIDIEARVVKIIHPDELNPQRMQVEITTRLRDIADVIASLYRELSP